MQSLEEKLKMFPTKKIHGTQNETRHTEMQTEKIGRLKKIKNKRWITDEILDMRWRGAEKSQRKILVRKM